MRSCSFSDAGVVVTVLFGLTTGAGKGSAAVWKRPMSPHAVSVAAAISRAGTAKRRRLIPNLRRPARPSTSSYSWIPRQSVIALHFFCWYAACLSRGKTRPLASMIPLKRDDLTARFMIFSENRFALPDHALVPAQHFNLSGPNHFDPWSRARLNPATDPNPPIFKGLKGHAGSFHSRHIAP